MHEAVRIYNNPEVVALLLDRGADVQAANDEGETPLHGAHQVEEVVLLLNHGADINVRDERGRTPLHNRAKGNREVVALLLDRGADIHAEDVWGRKPCRVAQDYIAHFAGTPELERLCVP